MLGDRAEYLRRWKGNVREEANLAGYTKLAQLGRQRNKMIVVEPYLVTGRDALKQFTREAGIHRHVGRKFGRMVFRQSSR